MRRYAFGVALLCLSFTGPGVAQQATSPATDAEVSCADILATPSASAEEIAALNDTSVVTVLRCREADASGAPSADVTALRSAVAANPALAPRLTAAGGAPDQVVAIRRAENGGFNIYVIGGYR
jgi:hypothetical protein